MKLRETLSSFVLGAAMAVGVHLWFADVAAQQGDDDAVLDVCVSGDGTMRQIAPAANCPSGDRRIRLKAPHLTPPCEKKTAADIAALEARVATLEGHSGEGLFDQKAIAPFNVVNEVGNVVFSVKEQGPQLPISADIFNHSGQRVAILAANDMGGAVSLLSVASGSDGTGPSAALDAFGDYADFTVHGSTGKRLELGRRSEGGRYGLLFFGAGEKRVAGFGESQAGSGIAVVFDAEGRQRASMYVDSETNAGIVHITDAAEKSMAELSGRGYGGSGLLQLKNASEETMVEAGVLDTGIGVVRAGPGAFQHGFGPMIGLPASYIEGKKE
jgi:hypothetical protein